MLSLKIWKPWSKVSKMVDVFTGGAVKDKIRKDLDTPLIREVSNHGKERLSYFGLSGPFFYDIIEWQRYLKDFTVVEKSYSGRRERSTERNLQELLLKNSFITQLRNGRGVIHDFLTMLYGDIDKDIILRGEGDFGKKLAKQSFGLIYLDYYGGIFKAKHREEAINKIISDQKRNSETDQSYVLLITVENLDKGEAEKRALVDEILKNLKHTRVERTALKNFTTFLSRCRYALLQKIYVPIQIYLFAKSCGDGIRYFEPVIYGETKPGSSRSAEMLHFRFIISVKKTGRPAVPLIKDIIDIYNLKLLTVREGKITNYKEQTPQLVFE